MWICESIKNRQKGLISSTVLMMHIFLHVKILDFEFIPQGATKGRWYLFHTVHNMVTATKYQAKYLVHLPSMPRGRALLLMLLSVGSPMTDWVTSHKYLWEVKPDFSAASKMNEASPCVQCRTMMRTSDAAKSVTSQLLLSEILKLAWTMYRLKKECIWFSLCSNTSIRSVFDYLRPDISALATRSRTAWTKSSCPAISLVTIPNCLQLYRSIMESIADTWWSTLGANCKWPVISEPKCEEDLWKKNKEKYSVWKSPKNLIFYIAS